MMSKIPSCEKDGLKKGPWTQEEDQKLIDYIRKHGHGRWRTLPKNAGLKRCGKSCRLRWTNYLRPDIKRGRFSFEEEETIIQLHSVLGNKWSMIAARLPGRTDNEIKNYWNTNIRKRLLKMGIDPITHTPRLDLLELSTILSSTLYNSQYSSINQNPNNYLIGNMGQLESSQNLLNLATTLLSYHPKSDTTNSATSLGFVPQNNAQETLALEQHILQRQFQYFQQNQLKSPTIPEIIQTSEILTTSGNSTLNVPCLNETQPIQAKIDQLSQTLMSSYGNNISAAISSTMWQNNVQAHRDESFMANNVALTGYQDSTQSSLITRNNNCELFSWGDTNNVAHTSFTSLISTPSTSQYRNYSCSTDTSQEDDERDGFLSASNMFLYDDENYCL